VAVGAEFREQLTYVFNVGLHNFALFKARFYLHRGAQIDRLALAANVD